MWNSSLGSARNRIEEFIHVRNLGFDIHELNVSVKFRFLCIKQHEARETQPNCCIRGWRHGSVVQSSLDALLEYPGWAFSSTSSDLNSNRHKQCINIYTDKFTHVYKIK